MAVDLVRYVMDCVLADNPDATPEELVELQTEALRQHGLVT